MNNPPRRKVKSELFDLVVGAIQASGWNVLYTAPIGSNPLHIIMQRDDASFPLTIYIWNLTHGGGARRPRQEYRVQITGVTHITVASGAKTLLLGWWGVSGVFAGFDASKHAGKVSASPSIQISEDVLEKAAERGIVPYNKGNGEIAFAIRPDMLATYIQDLATLHAIGTQPNEIDVIDTAVDEQTDDTAALEAVAEPRREVIRAVRAKIRSAQFRKRVLTAYNNACAMCSLQMELVEAAHIVPVAHPDSRDVISNGIALCALHHKAYDRGILTSHPESGTFRVALNLREIQRLADQRLIAGYEQFKGRLAPTMRLPSSSTHHPNVEYIALGNHLRGWSEEDFTDDQAVEFIS